nr:MAG: hypothetical protein [Wufeng shrew hepe-like virus 1]
MYKRNLTLRDHVNLAHYQYVRLYYLLAISVVLLFLNFLVNLIPGGSNDLSSTNSILEQILEQQKLDNDSTYEVTELIYQQQNKFYNSTSYYLQRLVDEQDLIYEELSNATRTLSDVLSVLRDLQGLLGGSVDDDDTIKVNIVKSIELKTKFDQPVPVTMDQSLNITKPIPVEVKNIVQTTVTDPVSIISEQNLEVTVTNTVSSHVTASVCCGLDCGGSCGSPVDPEGPDGGGNNGPPEVGGPGTGGGGPTDPGGPGTGGGSNNTIPGGPDTGGSATNLPGYSPPKVFDCQHQCGDLFYQIYLELYYINRYYYDSSYHPMHTNIFAYNDLDNFAVPVIFNSSTSKVSVDGNVNVNVVEVNSQNITYVPVTVLGEVSIVSAEALNVSIVESQNVNVSLVAASDQALVSVSINSISLDFNSNGNYVPTQAFNSTGGSSFRTSIYAIDPLFTTNSKRFPTSFAGTSFDYELSDGAMPTYFTGYSDGFTVPVTQPCCSSQTSKTLLFDETFPAIPPGDFKTISGVYHLASGTQMLMDMNVEGTYTAPNYGSDGIQLSLEFYRISTATHYRVLLVENSFDSQSSIYLSSHTIDFVIPFSDDYSFRVTNLDFGATYSPNGRVICYRYT